MGVRRRRRARVSFGRRSSGLYLEFWNSLRRLSLRAWLYTVRTRAIDLRTSPLRGSTTKNGKKKAEIVEQENSMRKQQGERSGDQAKSEDEHLGELGGGTLRDLGDAKGRELLAQILEGLEQLLTALAADFVGFH